MPTFLTCIMSVLFSYSLLFTNMVIINIEHAYIFIDKCKVNRNGAPDPHQQIQIHINKTLFMCFHRLNHVLVTFYSLATHNKQLRMTSPVHNNESTSDDLMTWWRCSLWTFLYQCLSFLYYLLCMLILMAAIKKTWVWRM